jgi:hypothetical protein
MSNTYILFSPFQIQEMGGKYYQGKEYSFRAQITKRYGIFKNIYIPYGPICKSMMGFEEFLKAINKQRLSKIQIDLPLILDPKIKEDVIRKLKQNGFSQTNYIQDEETILISKEDIPLCKHIQTNSRRALKNYKVVIKSSINDNELNQIYNLYVGLSKNIGFEPKSIEAFKAMSGESIFALGLNSIGEICGFILGYKSNLTKGTETCKVLQIIFTAVDDESRKQRLGYALHKILFEEAFENFGINYIDFHGASRSKGRKYTEFKEYFGGKFVSHAGSFEKLNLL